jgi:hypothetical protein
MWVELAAVINNATAKSTVKHSNIATSLDTNTARQITTGIVAMSNAITTLLQSWKLLTLHQPHRSWTSAPKRLQ